MPERIAGSTGRGTRGLNLMPTASTPDEIVGRSLRLDRVAAGVPLTALASRLGLSVGHLSNIEAGKRKASSELIARIRGAIKDLT